jgi:hypothetical protein
MQNSEPKNASCHAKRQFKAAMDDFPTAAACWQNGAFFHSASSQGVDRFWVGGSGAGSAGFCRKTLAHTTINAQHFDRGQGLGFEAQQLAGIGHAGLPADGKVLALETVGIFQRQITAATS